MDNYSKFGLLEKWIFSNQLKMDNSSSLTKHTNNQKQLLWLGWVGSTFPTPSKWRHKCRSLHYLIKRKHCLKDGAKRVDH